ncbi:hypothetical protein BKH46_01160 [Helicobacter sp. 12S02634-8]|uniref:pimelyl-ACP methyl ester esterase BioV n=1 Tax=Helicobacter sp. 12S02634-8 TaxID=1476199 RepID=UPI000BA7766F|nr:pimelyl-ACP methyl ester esterase BioV [Helicobacter sp. 12S02634-8]PAF48543.1 hypothetical protein BKH46_01160 [Helicobacter sp. 12S02634-8]
MYFSGFCFQGEQEVFKPLIADMGAYDVCGFSRGAQRAFEWAYERLENHWRIQKVILLSPALFQDKTKAFKIAQMRAFKKDAQGYVERFLQAAGVDKEMERYIHTENVDALQGLLEYVWSEEKLQKMHAHQVEIEVYLGGRDGVIDANYARDFFARYARVYWIKSANHCLKTSIENKA